MEKEKKSSGTEERKVHKISFKKEPIWLKMNIIGKYEGIKYRFTYKEYCNDEVDTPISSFVFTWPGRIPDDKAFAEEGIKAMFSKQLNDGGISFRVVKDDVDTITNLAEENALYDIDELDFSDEF